MQPGRYDITIYRGNDYKVTFTSKDTDSVDIDFGALYTGAKLQVRPAWARSQQDIVGDPLYEMSSEATSSLTMDEALVMADALVMTSDEQQIFIEDTTITIILTAEVTTDLPFQSGTYSLELYTAAGGSDPFMYGDITVAFERTV